ncbi:MAG: esterase, partial [Gammaproteobacteria bacterium]|nr:esterase [Gammaproteobacteria bacterium]
MSKITDDLRIDPSIRKFFGSVPDPVNQGDIENREKLLEETNSPAAIAFRKQMEGQWKNVYREDFEVPAGLTSTTLEFKSSP